MIQEFRPIPNPHKPEHYTANVTAAPCDAQVTHGGHFDFSEGQIFWCQGKTIDVFPVCQVAHPEIREVLPCKHEESGGYQCENLEPHTDEHKFGSHTIRHSLAGNGWSCGAIEENSSIGS